MHHRNCDNRNSWHLTFNKEYYNKEYYNPANSYINNI